MYAFLLLSVAMALFYNALIHRLPALRGGALIRFNLVGEAVCCVCLLALCACTGALARPSRLTVLYALGYGAATAVFLLSKSASLGRGPMHVASIFGCCSLLIPTVAGTVVWGEKVAPMQWAGVILLLAAMVLCVGVRRGSRPRGAYLLLCALFFLSSGAVGMVFKGHQMSDAAGEASMMLLLGNAFAFLLLLPACAVQKAKLAHPGTAAICGLLGCAYNRLNLYLSGAMPGALFFPLFNGLFILLLPVVCRIAFREKLSRAQCAGFLLGAAAIVLVSNIL